MFLAPAVAAVFGLVGVAATLAGVERLWTTHQLRSTTLDDRYDATAGGRVELEGSAEAADEVLTAPFSGRDCLAYRFEVAEHHADDDGPDWHTLASGTAGVPFRLVTADGEVLVRADLGPEFDVADDRTRVEAGAGEDPPERVSAFVAGEGVDAKRTGTFDLGPLSVATGDHRRYTEHRLEPGETVFVAGLARSHALVADVPVPDSVSAVVGPLDHDGAVARVRSRLGGLPFTVADAPLAEAANRSLGSGLLLLLGGLVFVAVPAAVLLAGT